MQLVPGLLQTEAYAREVLNAIPPVHGVDVGRHLEFRMKRQELLTDVQAPRFWVVLDEAVLRRRVGGPQVMIDQLERLIDAAGLANVTLQVLPFSVGVHAGMDGEFTILSYSIPRTRTWSTSKPRRSTLRRVGRRDPPVQLIFDELRAAALTRPSPSGPWPTPSRSCGKSCRRNRKEMMLILSARCG